MSTPPITRRIHPHVASAGEIVTTWYQRRSILLLHSPRRRHEHHHQHPFLSPWRIGWLGWRRRCIAHAVLAKEHRQQPLTTPSVAATAAPLPAIDAAPASTPVTDPACTLVPTPISSPLPATPVPPLLVAAALAYATQSPHLPIAASPASPLLDAANPPPRYIAAITTPSPLVVVIFGPFLAVDASPRPFTDAPAPTMPVTVAPVSIPVATLVAAAPKPMSSLPVVATSLAAPHLQSTLRPPPTLSTASSATRSKFGPSSVDRTALHRPSSSVDHAAAGGLQAILVFDPGKPWISPFLPMGFDAAPPCQISSPSSHQFLSPPPFLSPTVLIFDPDNGLIRDGFHSTMGFFSPGDGVSSASSAAMASLAARA